MSPDYLRIKINNRIKSYSRTPIRQYKTQKLLEENTEKISQSLMSQFKQIKHQKLGFNI